MMRPSPLLRNSVPLPRMSGSGAADDGGSVSLPPSRSTVANVAGMSKANPAVGKVLSRPRRPGDFPCIHAAVAGRPYRYSYHAISYVRGSDDGPVRACPHGELARTDVTGAGGDAEWWAGPSTIVGEPAFVAGDSSGAAYAASPRPEEMKEEAEGDRWLLSLCYDGVRRALVLHILEGDDIASGPVCSLQLPVIMPMTIHGTWTAELLL